MKAIFHWEKFSVWSDIFFLLNTIWQSVEVKIQKKISFRGEHLVQWKMALMKNFYLGQLQMKYVYLADHHIVNKGMVLRSHLDKSWPFLVIEREAVIRNGEHMEILRMTGEVNPRDLSDQIIFFKLQATEYL